MARSQRVAAVESVRCPSFFGIIGLCHRLDGEHTDVFRRRVTKFYIHDGGVCFKVLHSECGCIWAQAIELGEGDDIEFEVMRLHSIIDGRVKHDKRFIEELAWPPPF